MPRFPAPLGLVAALALPFAAPAAADTADALIARIDTDADGSLTRGEVLAFRRLIFARIDADASGSLTADEIETARRALPAAERPAPDSRIWRQDSNGDGRLSQEEFTRLPGFDRADRDGDGRLSPEEISRLRRFLAAFAG